jgi:hypothetical protein
MIGDCIFTMNDFLFEGTKTLKSEFEGKAMIRHSI